MNRAQPNIPIKLLLLDTFQYPTGILTQNNFSLEWVYTKHTFSKTITTYEEMLAYIIQQGIK